VLLGRGETADMEGLISVNLVVNGRAVEAKVKPDSFLLNFLRDNLGLTGAKNGCGTGHCGACTVIVDGKARRSCIVRMSRLEGSHVETIENLSKGDMLHPLQYTFMQEGAVQCGFCTPGLIMAAKALLDTDPSPTEEEIRSALEPNLCRCTGYAGIVPAVQRAGEMIRSGAALLDPATITRDDRDGSLIGASVLPKDLLGKVTGRPRFANDLYMENMLIGRIRWSDLPSAEILSVHTEEAEKMPGVALVLIARDIPGLNKLGIIRRDQPAIAADRVRCISDPIAAVFAESEEIAQMAIDRIEIKYRPLPGVFSIEEAAAPDAPLVHETGNICHQAFIKRGDVQKAFEEAAVVHEDTYTTPVVDQAFLEPEAGLAWPTGGRGVVIEIGTQANFDDREQLALALDMPKEKIRVVQLPLGGAFGGKEDIILQFLLALGALRSGRPVKMVLCREESFRTHPKRHASKLRYKTAAGADGKLLAVEACIELDTGAYASLGPDVLENTVSFAAGPYFVPNLNLEAKAYYTNNPPCGAMRGFGAPQVAFAMEQQMDAMARVLGMNPFEIRLKNALDVGVPLATDHVLESSVGIKTTLQKARDLLHQLPRPDTRKRLGVGVASGMKNIGFGHGLVEEAGAIVELTEKGVFQIRHGVNEYGQGAHTAIQQIAAAELGVTYEQVETSYADTALSPRTGPTTASRQLYLSGNAVVKACREMKKKIFESAEEELNIPAAELDIRSRRLVHVPSGREFELNRLSTRLVTTARFRAPKTIPFAEEASGLGKPGFVSRRTHWAYSFATHVAIVEVDEETGQVQVLQMIAAHDVGRAINPRLIEGQITGAVVMGVGYALSEEFVVKDGVEYTRTFREYRLPTIKDQPQIFPIIVENPVPEGPFGAKGVGEAALIPVAAAIVNAIYDAIGVRITSLPARKSRVLAAIQERREQ